MPTTNLVFFFYFCKEKMKNDVNIGKTDSKYRDIGIAISEHSEKKMTK